MGIEIGIQVDKNVAEVSGFADIQTNRVLRINVTP